MGLCDKIRQHICVSFGQHENGPKKLNLKIVSLHISGLTINDYNNVIIIIIIIIIISHLPAALRPWGLLSL
jgi:hypothetical protein